MLSYTFFDDTAYITTDTFLNYTKDIILRVILYWRSANKSMLWYFYSLIN